MQQVTERVLPGWKVVGSDDKEIGQVSDVGTTHLEVSKGLIFAKTLYVPYEFIAREDDVNERVYLSVGKETVDGMGWDQPPGDDRDDPGDAPLDPTIRDDSWRMPH